MATDGIELGLIEATVVTPLTPPAPTGIADGGRLPDVSSPKDALAHPSVAHRFQLLGDMTLFSLGPVYVHAGLDRDLLVEFREQTEPFEVQNFHYTTPVLQGVLEWDFILQAVPDAVFPFLDKFLTNYILTRTPLREFYRIKRTWVAGQQLLLPGGEPGPRTHVAVYLPSSNQRQWQCLFAPAPGLAYIASARPDPKIVAEAETYFHIVG